MGQPAFRMPNHPGLRAHGGPLVCGEERVGRNRGARPDEAAGARRGGIRTLHTICRCPNSTEERGCGMREAVYNSGIPNIILNSVNRASRAALNLFFSTQLLFVVLALVVSASAVDWSGPELQLARKIVSVTGPGAVPLTVENRSSLGKRDYEIIQNGLRSTLGGLGLRFVGMEQAAATISISLSENASSYVWVAEIHQGANEVAVVMVSALRPEGTTAVHDAVPLTLRKIPVFAQDDPILDVAVLEENTAPTHIAVLDPDKVS